MMQQKSARTILLLVLLAVVVVLFIFKGQPLYASPTSETISTIENVHLDKLPLAEEARPIPKKLPWEEHTDAMQLEREQLSFLIASADFSKIEQKFVDWETEYEQGKIRYDELYEHFNNLSLEEKQATETALLPYQNWIKKQPNSFLAHFALSRSYRNLAWKKRGGNFVNKTSENQLSEFEKYITLAKDNALASKPLAKTKGEIVTINYATAIFIKITGDPRIQIARPEQDVLQAIQERFIPQKTQGTSIQECLDNQLKDDHFSSSLAAQFYYVCQAYRMDSNIYSVWDTFFFYNSPRWGGSWKLADMLLDEMRDAKRTSPEIIQALRASVETGRGKDSRNLNNDVRAAMEHYAKAASMYPISDTWMKERYNNYCWAGNIAFRELKEYDKAIGYYTKQAEVVPDDPEAYAEIGWANEQQHNLQAYMDYQIKAAMLGKMETQNNVGYYYMLGQRGLPRDLHQAKAWLTLAANQGFEHSKQKIKMIDEMLEKEAKH